MTEQKISIVTAVYNGAEYIERCITSVLSQNHAGIEHIIVDGGSTDSTVTILQKYRERIQYICEPDRGIYDALNKGVRLANGDWILVLGSDDYLASSNSIRELFDRCPGDLSDISVITGYVIYSDGRLFRSDNLRHMKWRNRVHHQGALYRRNVLIDRSFDVSLKVYADYDLNLNLWLNNAVFHHTDCALSIVGIQGLSDRPVWRNYCEEMLVRAKHLHGPILWTGHVFAIARYLYKYLRQFFVCSKR